MPHQIQLIGTGPGQGIFELPWDNLGVDALELAIQRNADDKYLGPDLEWQTSIHWHWCPCVDTDSHIVRLAAGADIVDGILGSAVNALLAEVRGEGRRDSGILRIRDLVGSPAGAERRRIDTSSTAKPPPAPESTMGPADIPRPRPRPVWLWVLLAVAGLALVALSVAWYSGMFDSPEIRGSVEAPDTIDPVPANSVPPSIDAAVEPSPPQPVQTEGTAQETPRPPQPTLTGRAMVQRYLQQAPSASELLDQAELREESGDCEAAILLFERSASADPALAMRVAKRYDPDGFQASPCIGSPNRESAQIWYEDAARVGDIAAQRRLGQLLVEQAASGIVHEEGREWLLKAATAGDNAAQQTLEQLEQQ